MEISFTLWSNLYDTQAKPHTLSINSWEAEFGKVEVTDLPKTRLPCVILGRMVDKDRRKNKNVLTIEGLALDIERKKQDRERYDAHLRHALHQLDHLRYWAYTTYSHTNEDPRLRIVLPLAGPVDPKRYKAAMGYLNTLTGCIADPDAQKLSQPVFLPLAPSSTIDQAWAAAHDGELLDLDEEVAQEVVELRATLGEGLGRAPMEAHTRQACKKVLLCQPYAEEGNRDETAVRIAWHLAKRHPAPSLAALETVFYWSTRAMGPDAPTADNILSKIERGAEKQVDQIVPSTEWEGSPAIVQFRTNYSVRLPDGGYSRLYIKDEARSAVQRHLRGAEDVQLITITETGKKRPKSLEALIQQYGELAEDVVIDLNLPQSKYENNILREASIRWPKLESSFDSDIDHWVHLLGGQKLKDWLSLLHDLTRSSSALVIMGPRNIGKTLLAMGCASRFGSSAPARQSALTGNFQEELARCPLVYIDEDIEDNPYNRNFLATIRSELSVRERSVNRKYLAPTQMLGAIRCIISANHLPFKQKDAQTGQDLEAIAERFYWINVGRSAADFLATQQPETLNYWRQTGIPRYIKHLEETRTVSRRNRFGVSGDSEMLADLINMSVRWNSWVTEWICNGAMDGFAKLNVGDKDVDHGARIYQGNIYVRVKTIVKAWERYLQNNRTAPDTRPISQALRGIAVPDQRFRPRDIGLHNGNNQVRYYKIRRSPLLTFLEQTGSGTSEELEHALKGAKAP